MGEGSEPKNATSADRNQRKIEQSEANLARRKFQQQLRDEVELLSDRQGVEMSSDEKRRYYRTRHLSTSELSEKQVNRLLSKLATDQPEIPNGEPIQTRERTLPPSNLVTQETELKPELVALKNILSIYSDRILRNYKDASTKLLKFQIQSRDVEDCSEQTKVEIQNYSVTFPYLIDLYELRGRIPESEFDGLEHMLTTQEEIIIEQVRSIEENIAILMEAQTLILNCIVKPATPYGQRRTSGFAIIPTHKNDLRGIVYEEFSNDRREFDAGIAGATNSGTLNEVPCAPQLGTLTSSFHFGRVINPELVFPEELIFFKLATFYSTMIDKHDNTFKTPKLDLLTKKYNKVKQLFEVCRAYELSGKRGSDSNALFALGSIFDALLGNKEYHKNDAAREFGANNTPAELVIKMSDFLENNNIK